MCIFRKNKSTLDSDTARFRHFGFDITGTSYSSNDWLMDLSERLGSTTADGIFCLARRPCRCPPEDGDRNGDGIIEFSNLGGCTIFDFSMRDRWSGNDLELIGRWTGKIGPTYTKFLLSLVSVDFHRFSQIFTDFHRFANVFTVL